MPIRNERNNIGENLLESRTRPFPAAVCMLLFHSRTGAERYNLNPRTVMSSSCASSPW